MRCLACNEELTDEESVQKDENDEHLDICFNCQRKTVEALYEEDTNDHIRVGCRDEH